MNIKIYTDGGARGNPGKAAIGVVVVGMEEKDIEIGEFVGVKTNNQAEYLAIIRGLTEVAQKVKKCDIINIECFLDSLLVVEQVNGKWKIKNEGLKPLYAEVRELVMTLGGKVSFKHIPREENSRADSLVNSTLDKTP